LFLPFSVASAPPLSFMRIFLFLPLLTLPREPTCFLQSVFVIAFFLLFPPLARHGTHAQRRLVAIQVQFFVGSLFAPLCFHLVRSTPSLSIAGSDQEWKTLCGVLRRFVALSGRCAIPILFVDRDWAPGPPPRVVDRPINTLCWLYVCSGYVVVGLMFLELKQFVSTRPPFGFRARLSIVGSEPRPAFSLRPGLRSIPNVGDVLVFPFPFGKTYASPRVPRARAWSKRGSTWRTARFGELPTRCSSTWQATPGIPSAAPGTRALGPAYFAPHLRKPPERRDFGQVPPWARARPRIHARPTRARLWPVAGPFPTLAGPSCGPGPEETNPGKVAWLFSRWRRRAGALAAGRVVRSEAGRVCALLPSSACNVDVGSPRGLV